MRRVVSSKVRQIAISVIYSIFILSILSINVSVSQETPESDTRMERMIDEVNIEKTKPACSSEVVDIAQGKLCGISVKTVSGKKLNAYLGIPIAESTAGENRWRAPVPDSGWKGVYNATSLGSACPQINAFDKSLPYSEECLSVNVWVPVEKSKDPRPVMLYIYGGDFTFGFSGDPLYDGAYSSAHGGVIVVSMNYRVGALGFLAGIKDKETGEKLDGNYGLLDQILAMKWVQKNIGAFGGDPRQVTLYGQSAGAMSVGIHLTASPASKDLFNSAIMESNPLGLPFNRLKQARQVAKKFAKTLGCRHDDIECMRSKSTKEILQAQNESDELFSTLLHGISRYHLFAPVIEGKTFTGHPLNEAKKHNVLKPLIIGTNKNEAVLYVNWAMEALDKKSVSDLDYSAALDLIFSSDRIKNKILEEYPAQNNKNAKIFAKVLTDYLFTCPSLYFADNSSMSTWVYQFDHIPSFNIYEILDFDMCADAVCHGAELAFVFHTAKNLGFTFLEQEKMLSNVMVDYWTNMAKNENPNGAIPKWPEYKSKKANVILVTPIDKIESSADLKARCRFWDKIGYDHHHDFWQMF